MTRITGGEIVQSLAKWKRYALHRYGFQVGEGLYTDMNAVRRDEVCDAIHSIYVDQWDWEKIITEEDRTLETLQDTVKTVYKAIRKTEQFMAIQYDTIDLLLPKDIFFLTTARIGSSLSESNAEGKGVSDHEGQKSQSA